MLLTFIGAAFVVVVLTAGIWKNSRDAHIATNMLVRVHEVINCLFRANNDATDVELATQNYRISGNTINLKERDAAIMAREITLNQLKQLTATDPVQQISWLQLRKVIDERIAISKQAEFLRKTQGYEAATTYIYSAPLVETRHLMYNVLREMEDRELQYLIQRNVEYERARAEMTILGSLIAALLLLGLSGSYWLFRVQWRSNVRNQRALAMSEENLRITLYAIGDGVIATDHNGRITQMNAMAEKLTGALFDEVQGKHVDEVFIVIDEQTGNCLISPVSLVLETAEPKKLVTQVVLISRDGSELPISENATPIRDQSGCLSGVVLVFRDVTDSQLAQKKIAAENEYLEQRMMERSRQLLESEEHLTQIICNMPSVIAFVDAQQRYVYVNDNYLRCFAPAQHNIDGLTVREILGEDRYAIVSPMILQVLQGQAQSYDWQPFPGVWHVVNYTPKFDQYGLVIGYYVLGTDISERKLTEEKIGKLNTQLALQVSQLESVSRALRTTSAGNKAMLHAENEQDLLYAMCNAIGEAGTYPMTLILYCVNDEFKTLQPMAENGFPGALENLKTIKFSWGDNEFGRGAVATAIRTKKTIVLTDVQTNSNYAQWREISSNVACVIACPLEVDGEIIGAISVYATEANAFSIEEVALLSEAVEDLAFGISTLRAKEEREKSRKAIFNLTRFDQLTGLPNETQFVESLAKSIRDSSVVNQTFVVIQTNIERLNEINAALGFSQGDQMLKDLGLRLRDCLPAHAMLARLRGDEFAILLPDSAVTDAIDCVRQIEAALVRPFIIANIPLDVSLKMGIAIFPQHGGTTHDLLRFTDMAAHQAKRRGLDYVIFDPIQNVDQSQRLNMAGELKHAIESGELKLYMQPKVNIRSGKVCGNEALVRWQHPTKGMIHPGEFISLAEHTGLIKPLSEWVIMAALQQLQKWREWEGLTLPLAINLSVRNLRDEKLLEKIEQMRELYQVPAGLLEVEITESMVMDDAEFSLHVLSQLSGAGIRLYIDDFGTGYSSLSYLQKLPVEYIKIDQSFIAAMSVSKESERIVQSTIDLAHDLGCKVVAEGVETQAQWDQLAIYGCDIAQGYLIARPMPAGDFTRWLDNYDATH